MNKPTQKELIDLTEKLVLDFQELVKAYIIKQGIPLIPSFKLKPLVNIRKLLTLDEIIDIVDKSLLNRKELYPKGIRTKCRLRELVLIRQVICTIGRELGYTHSEMGEKLGINHSTVTHSCKQASYLLDTQDREILRVNTEIRKLVNDYYIEKYGEDISEIIK